MGRRRCSERRSPSDSSRGCAEATLRASYDSESCRHHRAFDRRILMSEAPRRPFYAEFAWAFDLLIDRPVEKECRVMAAWLVGRKILPGAGLLDAGCGTGRYSRELARRGYIVDGVDLSPELIEVAKGIVGDRTGGVSFAVADILAPPTTRYAAIVCRGVLND